MNSITNPVYCWFENPPKASKGAFNYLANTWPGEVYFVINKDFREERKIAHWDDNNYGRARIICLYECNDPDIIISDILRNNPNAIHIVNGFLTPLTNQIKKYILQVNCNLLVQSERPVEIGNAFEHLLRRIFQQFKYSKICREFSPYVKAFMPLGQQGVNVFKRFGWDSKQMYPFMYNPQIEDLSRYSNKIPHKSTRFLYVGRFYYKTKGTDVLMKAIPKLSGSWSLDMVGGYGIDAEAVIQWIKRFDNVHYLGTWDSRMVVRNMLNYDVVVVPTRYDGWNLLVNEAIHAGIGVIATNEAVSHEVIETTNTGLVVNAGRPKDLAAAMQFAIDHPAIVSEWKMNSEKNISIISSDIVGKYLIEIIYYSIFQKGNRPKCPWL